MITGQSRTSVVARNAVLVEKGAVFAVSAGTAGPTVFGVSLVLCRNRAATASGDSSPLQGMPAERMLSRFDSLLHLLAIVAERWFES